MYEITVKIAEHCVVLNAIHPQALFTCLPYKVTCPAEFVVKSTVEEIDAERDAMAALDPDRVMVDSVIESTVLLRKVADRMLDYDTILLHGAVIAVDDAAYLFSAKSGTGKTTHIFKWLTGIPGAYVLNGDKPLIITGENPRACGTPWCGQERMSCNKIVPLKAIVFMERSEDNKIRPMNSLEAFPLLLGQTHRPEDSDKMKKTVHLLTSLLKSVSFYKFHFNNFRDDCLDVAYETLVGGNCKK